MAADSGGVKVRIGVIVTVLLFVFGLITAAVGFNYSCDAKQTDKIDHLSEIKSNENECKARIARTEKMITESEGRIVAYMKERFDRQDLKFREIERKMP